MLESKMEIKFKDLTFLCIGIIRLLYICIFQAQIHLVGNLLIWYSGSIAVVVFTAILLFHLLRRRRACYDISQGKIELFLVCNSFGSHFPFMKGNFGIIL